MKLPENRLVKVIIILFVFGFGGGLASIAGLTTSSPSRIPSQEQKPTPTVTKEITTPINTPTSTITPKKDVYKVLKVIDGDTLDVSINGRRETLRLIGIDTPETVDPRKPVQCFGKEASDKAKEILNGKSVLLEPDNSQSERDKYNRLLRYVILQDGTNFNKYMISEGFAHEYTYQSNPYKYQSEFKQAERKARENKKGLWSDTACGSVPSAKPQIRTQPKTRQTSQSPAVNTGSYSCNCAKLCSQIASCEEAKYQLNQCGCSARDSDGDGIPCESLCR